MKIALLGDIALFGCYSLKNNDDLCNKLSEISEHLHQFDYVIGNLETPFSVKAKRNGAKSAYIYSDTSNISVLKQLNITHVNLANNHMFDFGKEGYNTTIKLLEDADIEHFGTSGKSCFIEDESSKLALSGFCCYSSNPLEVGKNYGDYGINGLNIGNLKAILASNHRKGYLNLFSIHSGQEHIHYPSVDLIKMARDLSKIAPYIFYGHHPHAIQGQEVYNQSLISYSLGNFCFDDVYNDIDDTPLIRLSQDNRTGLIVEIEICDNKIINYKNSIISIQNDGCIAVRPDTDVVATYSKPLKNALLDSEYTLQRNRNIQEYLNNRKSKRDFSWYIKRLRYRYFKVLYNAYRNQKQYHNNVSAFLTE